MSVSITDPRAASNGLSAVVRAYVAVTKPRIIELLLVTTVPAMVLAAEGWPGLWLVVATVIGGTLSAGGANAINNVIDRDIDSVMGRTSRRPLPSHQISPGAALRFGVLLGSAGFLWLWATTNLLAAALSTGALLFYVFVYTLGLKRRSPQNIVIGGAAGAAPVLVGWAAVTGTLALPAWLMFALVFAWTPPHFWALALRYRDDYSKAAIPMLPAVAGIERTSRSIVSYSALTVLVSIALGAASELGLVYLVAAVALGAWLLLEALRLWRDPSRAMVLFRYSTIYLAVLFAAIWVDQVV